MGVIAYQGVAFCGFFFDFNRFWFLLVSILFLFYVAVLSV